MFDKRHRFSFKRGVPKRYLSTPFLIIRYDNNALRGLECSVVVGKKVDKRAVVRNRIKRKLVQLIKENIEESKKMRIVLFAKKSINEHEFSEISKSIIESLRKIKNL